MVGRKNSGHCPIELVTVGSGTLTRQYPNPVETSVTLNLADAGTPFTHGPLAGDYILYSYYSGDDSFAGDTSFDAARYAEANKNGGIGSGYGNYIVEFTGTKKPTSGISVIKGPSNTAVGDKIDPVKVAALDSAGTVNPTANTTVIVAIASTSTGTGTLSGTTSAATVHGVATFSDLTINKPGQYSFTFSDTQGDTTTSGLFNITGGKLVFLPPGLKDGSAGSALKSFVVALEDSKNRIITSDSSSVVTLTPIGTKANPVFSGNVQQLVNGKATFSNLILKNPDLYKLNADDGVDTDATSSRFKVTGDHLSFAPQPKGGDVETPLPLTVVLKNQSGQIDTAATDTVVLSLVALTGGAGAFLSGTVSMPFVAGKAIFTSTNGPKINAKGTYKLTATAEDTATGVLSPSTPVTSNPFTLKAYSLKLISPLGPFVAHNPDISGNAGAAESFIVLDPHGKPLTSVTALPTMHLTAVPMGGEGGFSGETADSAASDELPLQDFGRDITVTGSITQAYYGFHFDFSAAGRYQVTIADSSGADAASSLIAPYSVDIVVNNPEIKKSSPFSVHAGQDTLLSFTTVRPEKGNAYVPNPFDTMELKPSVGIHVQLVSSSTHGEMTGTTTIPFANHDGIFSGAGGQIGFNYSAADVHVSFTKGGTYTLAVSEVSSADGQPFDATSAATVSTTRPLLMVVKVLADRVAFTQNPSATITAGQPFNAAVSLETSDGTVLTDAAGGDDDLQFIATLTVVGLKGVSTTLATNVPFVAGVATFDNLMLPTPGAYRLHVVVTATNSEGGVLSPTDLTAVSNIFTISTAGT